MMAQGMSAGCKRGVVPAALLLALSLLTGCSKPEPATVAVSTEPVLARVGERRIFVADLKKEAQRRVDARLPVPDKEALLREMVAYEAMAQRARKAGVADDLRVKRQMDNILIGELKQRELSARLAAIEISDEEVRAEYEARIAQYTHPAQVRLAALFLKTDKVMSDDKRKELIGRLSEARSRALENPAPGGRGPAAGGFAALAIEYSEDQVSRYRGGDMGWMEEGSASSRWPESVLKAGYALAKCKISDVIEAEGGYYLVMKSDERAAAVTPFEKVAASLRQSLLVKKQRELNEAYREESLRLAAAEIDLDLLASVSLPGAGDEGTPGREPELPVLPEMKKSHDSEGF